MNKDEEAWDEWKLINNNFSLQLDKVGVKVDVSPEDVFLAGRESLKEEISDYREALKSYANKTFYNGHVFVTPAQVGDDDYDWCPDDGELARQVLDKYKQEGKNE